MAEKVSAEKLVDKNYRRIPVCLKFDADEPFFNDFVAPLKDSKDLSTFIIKLLRCYYETDTVREGVDDTLATGRPFEVINQGLQRIIDTHNENVMALSGMQSAVMQGRSVMEGVAADFVEEFGEEYESTERQRVLEHNRLLAERQKQLKDVQLEQGTGSTPTPLVLEARVNLIEQRLNKVDSIDSQLQQIMQAMGIAAPSVQADVVTISDTSVETSLDADVDLDLDLDAEEDLDADDDIMMQAMKASAGTVVMMAKEEDAGVSDRFKKLGGAFDC